jgi:hypothetical protein
VDLDDVVTVVDVEPDAAPRLRPTNRLFGVFFGLSTTIVSSLVLVEESGELIFVLRILNFQTRKTVCGNVQAQQRLLSSLNDEFIQIHWSTNSIGKAFVELEQNRMFRTFHSCTHNIEMSGFEKKGG